MNCSLKLSHINYGQYALRSLRKYLYPLPPTEGAFALDPSTPPPLGICLPGITCQNATPPEISEIFQLG